METPSRRSESLRPKLKPPDILFVRLGMLHIQVQLAIMVAISER